MPALTIPVVVCDHARRTAIVVNQKDGIIAFIPLNYEVGFQVDELGEKEFGLMYPTVMADYPVERAAALYVQYALTIGASKDALDSLGRLTKLTDKDREMATKTPAAEKPANKIPAAKKAPAVKTPKAPKAEKVAKEPKVKTPKAAAEPKAPRVTVSSVLRDLLVAQSKGENKFTDDQIFAKVQKQFGLDDNKRSYISWYRSDAIRKGLIKAPKK